MQPKRPPLSFDANDPGSKATYQRSIIMESRVQLFLRINSEEKPLSSVPVNYEELLKAVNKETGVFNFSVKLAGTPINSSQDLVIAYLNSREDRLVFDVEEIVPTLSHMDASSQMMFQSMMDKFKQFAVGEESKTTEKLELRNGIISKSDLIKVINAMSEYAKSQLAENTNKFQERRQALFDDETGYKEVVMEQLQFQEMLILSSTMDVCARFGISSENFDMSCRQHASDPTVRNALEEMAMESMHVSGAVPESLTKEKLKEVLNYSCGYLNRYIDEHPNMQPLDTVVLKMRESDEVMRVFGFTEVEISSALGHYKLETDPFWADIREKMGQVTTRLFSSQGGFPGMGGFPQ